MVRRRAVSCTEGTNAQLFNTAKFSHLMPFHLCLQGLRYTAGCEYDWILSPVVSRIDRLLLVLCSNFGSFTHHLYIS